MTPLAELRPKVTDRDSFLAFVTALAAEREEAERMERDEPKRYQLGGANDWQNSTISSFLGAALVYFQPTSLRKPDDTPSWKMMADFLYYGKIYEVNR
jgi:hypothetical protein